MAATIPRTLSLSGRTTVWCSLLRPSAARVRFCRSDRPIALRLYVISSCRGTCGLPLRRGVGRAQILGTQSTGGGFSLSRAQFL